MRARRLYFLIWLLLSPLLFMFFLVWPICLTNLIMPAQRRWKTVALVAAFALFPVAAILNTFPYGNYYWLALTAVYFALMLPARTRRPTFAVTLALAAGLLGASLLTPFLGAAGLALVGLGALAGGWWLWRSPHAASLFEAPADVFTHYFMITLALLTWFFFLPSPLPSRWVAAQPGVQVVAAADSDPAYRAHFLLHQMNMVDQTAPGELLIGSKRRVPGGETIHRNFLYDLAARHLAQSPMPGAFTTVHLIRCGPDDYLLPSPDERSLGERLVNVGRGFTWYGPTMSGYCLPGAGLYLVGDETSVRLLDRATGETVHRFTFDEVFPQAPLRFFAPYGVGKIATFHHGYLTRLHVDETTRAVGESPYRAYAEPFSGETLLLGAEGHAFVYLIASHGKIRKIEPDAGRVVAENSILPGFRFATLDERLELIYVVHDLLGMVEVIDARTMRRLDRLYVGHAARRVNLSPYAPGVAYTISGLGVLRLDFCERLPGRCPAG
jgi:hypothetical protein